MGADGVDEVAGARIRCPVHVGRRVPVATVTAAAAGRPDAPRVVLVGGEAGVGKSRLTAEAMRAARDHGQPVLATGCHPGASIPYEPFVALMRRSLRGPERRARDLFRGTASLAATLLPELAEDGGPLSALDLDGDHIAAAVVDAVARMVDGERGLLCLEDLHWAGGDTVRVVAHLLREVRHLPLWVIATYRDDEIGDDHPLRAVLVEAERSPDCAPLRLRTLTPADVGVMVEAILPAGMATAEIAAALAGRSRGNPLFVEELCSRLIDGTDIAVAALPGSIQESVRARLRGLDASAREILCVAAVAGETVDADLVARVTGAGEHDLDAALAQGIAQGLMVERLEAGVPVATFRHALTREAVAAELRGGARRRAHARIAVGLAGTDEERAGEVADHLAAAGDVAAARDQAVVAARLAARRAAAAECRDRYRQALGLTAPGSGRLPLLVEAAETLRGAADAADPFVAEGRALARSSGDTLARARLLVVEAVLEWWRGDSAAASRRWVEAHELVRGRGDHWELSILLELARAHANRDQTAAAAALLARGGELVDAGVGRPRDAVELLTLMGLLGRGDAERAARYTAAMAAAERVGDPSTLCVAVADAGFSALWWPGDLPRARSLLERAIETALAVRPVNAIAYRATVAWVDSVAGSLDAAATGAGTVLAETTNPPSRIVSLLALTEAHHRRGRAEDADVSARQALELAEATGEPQWITPALAVVARSRVRDGLHEARPWFDRMLRAGGGAQPHWYGSPDLARALFAAGAADALTTWCEAVATAAAPGEHRHDGAALALCRALAALAGGDVDRARELARSARDAFRAMPCPAREAEAELARSAVEERAGELAAAATAASAALRIAERMGFPALLAEARERLRRAGAGLPRAANGTGPVARRAAQLPSPLTRREGEVAALVAAGLSNGQIAQQLYVSENTVETHVSHILGKLGFRRRAQIAGWAAQADASTPRSA